MKKSFIFFLFILIARDVVSQDVNVQQKEGLVQNSVNRHIEFIRFEKFQQNSANEVIGNFTKIIKYDDHLFILDGRQDKIFVFDNKAKYLYSMGRAGQGPGDLEHPSDFFIANDGLIYVLNPMPGRIEVFSIKGRYVKRVKLAVPKEIYYSHPNSILVTRDREFIVAYSLSQHLIDVYNEEGAYLKTLLKREDEVGIPGENIGNCSQIQFVPREDAILHFDYFTGIFTKISTTGNVERQFSVFDALQNREVENVKNDILAKRKAGRPGSTSILEFQLWSRFGLDGENNIYAFLLLRKKGDPQNMFVFSPRGEFLYRSNPPSFIEGGYVDDLYCFEDLFVFKTPDDDVFMAIKRINKDR